MFNIDEVISQLISGFEQHGRKLFLGGPRQAAGDPHSSLSLRDLVCIARRLATEFSHNHSPVARRLADLW